MRRQYISVDKDADATERRVFTLDVTTGEETLVVAMAGLNQSVQWTPDGRFVVFVKDPVTRAELWAVPVVDGRAAGSPRRLHESLGGAILQPLGFSRSGSLMVYRSPLVEQRTFFLSGVESTQTSNTLLNANAAISPDGRSIAMVRRGVVQELVVRTMATGEERLLSDMAVAMTPPRWLHDGRSLLVTTSVAPDGWALQRVDLQTGRFAVVLTGDRSDAEIVGDGPVSIDDREVFATIRARGPRTPETAVVAVNLSTGARRTAETLPGGGLFDVSLALSPDGSKLALMARDSRDAREAAMYTMNTDGTGFRRISDPFLANWTADVTQWTPDGQSIVFIARQDTNGGGPTPPPPTTDWRLMRIPASGGPATAVGVDSVALSRTSGLSVGGPRSLTIGPDGTVAVSVAVLTPGELWTLDNVLAALAGR